MYMKQAFCGLVKMSITRLLEWEKYNLYLHSRTSRQRCAEIPPTHCRCTRDSPTAETLSDTDELKNTEGRRWCRRRWLVALEDRRWAGSALTRVISLKTVVFGEEIPWQRRSTVFLGYQCFFEAMFVVEISLVTAALGNELTPILFVLTRYPVWLTGHP